MAIIYAMNEAGLTHFINETFTPISAYSFMIFILLYIPCLATIATIRKETNSWKWVLFSFIYPLAVAYFMSLAFYQIAQFIL